MGKVDERIKGAEMKQRKEKVEFLTVVSREGLFAAKS